MQKPRSTLSPRYHIEIIDVERGKATRLAAKGTIGILSPTSGVEVIKVLCCGWVIRSYGMHRLIAT